MPVVDVITQNQKTAIAGLIQGLQWKTRMLSFKIIPKNSNKTFQKNLKSPIFGPFLPK